MKFGIVYNMQMKWWFDGWCNVRGLMENRELTHRNHIS